MIKIIKKIESFHNISQFNVAELTLYVSNFITYPETAAVLLRQLEGIAVVELRVKPLNF